MKHINIKITGRVQGVFFRMSAKNVAKKLSINGYAKNVTDGSLYIEAEGNGKSIDRFVSWCKIGPRLALIKNIEISNGKIKNYTSFRII